MRRAPTALLAAILLAAPMVAAVAPTASAQNQPPHSFLFGTWTGGVFPAPPGISPAACFSQPVVVFTRDLVMRATLTEQFLTQREIETVRATPAGLEFRFLGSGGGGLLNRGAAPMTGFGCDGTDVLRVQRRGENEITFPGCTDFPNPLVRCQTR